MDSSGKHQFGKYKIVERIGSGGFSEVYKGFDPLIKRHVAVKTLTARDPDLRSRFSQEAEIAGRLQHRNIVTVFDFGFEGEMPYLVQEYLAGEDLDRKIKRDTPLPLATRIDILYQVALGLANAHGEGIIHRDIKPGNVRILEDGTAKIMDFGIAKLLNEDTGLTKTGMTVGTAAYLAPEQIRGRRADPRTDVFSFGVMAYELLTSSRPFAGAQISAVLYQILNEEPHPLVARAADCPPPLADLVMRCLHKDPEARPDDGAALACALAEIQASPHAAIVAHAQGTQTQGAGAEGTEASVPPAARDLGVADLELQLADAANGGDPASLPVPTPRRRRWRLPLALLAVLLSLGLGWWLLPQPWLLGGTPGEQRPRAQEPTSLDESQSLPNTQSHGEDAQAEDGAGGDDEPSDATPTAANGQAANGQAANERDTAGPPGPPSADPARVAPPPSFASPDSASPDSAQQPSAPPPPPPAMLRIAPAWDPSITVSIDGQAPQPLARSLRRRLRPGSHRLLFRIDAAGYRQQSEIEVEVRAGQTLEVDVPLAPAGSLVVYARPDGLEGTVELDGEISGNGRRVAFDFLAPGAHQLKLTPLRAVPGAHVVTLSVTVRSGEQTMVTYDLASAEAPSVRQRGSGAKPPTEGR